MRVASHKGTNVEQQTEVQPEPPAASSAPATTPATMIEAHGLSKYYGPFVAVQDASFSIPEGQVVAFLGPNGAGKSTLMRMLTGFLAPSAGQAAIAGFDVREQRIEASRRLGYLPESGPLYPDMTPLELLQFFGEARELAAPTLKRRIEEVVEICALELVLEKPIGKLSKGYKQRVGLAQALLHDPAVLIMDEPTAGLDPNQIKQFRENIQRLGRTKTLLISTHILQEVEAVADRVMLINNGRLLFDGPRTELEENGSLEEPFYRLTRETPPVGVRATPPPAV
jgi:ABC-2 type transport system ATP-binding protein